uniref:Dynein light chain tctex-type 1 n=1 Tax=Tetraselmis sp. GSL018 TaxID=582737 RepID=A0A061QX45_9CHLO|mmetsp:Transcript_21746/g.51966  ORF Transcript_21746/g.51966 Transcript_21746/m.51966 type:complete len:118 (+) Transcript_21746:222-575(+)|eukprot:CAMPEP_0177608780 /NCGR_PEP_ID=MMETSP0419_2-20121207/18671_1 /TAXON_ID=582737 /ORGANISM="Tetraselmis sp., Strain GSL018" /LENGTH=117 /DNA_ID=CAMNT_0019103527 /DNA_START=166 /DNA_END=519 /DNA_ORIENTATION=+
MDEDQLPGGLTEEDLLDEAEVDTMIRQVISDVLGEQSFQHAKADAWTKNIIEDSLKKLQALQKPFKYVVTCCLTQKAGAGLHMASCTRWDERVDSKCTVQWESQTMHVIVSSYWCAI